MFDYSRWIIGNLLIRASRMIDPNKKKYELINKYYTDRITLKNNAIFQLDPQIDTVFQVMEDYNFDDLFINDVVLDVGGCIGGFTIPAALRCKHVYCIEPMTPQIIKNNITINNIKNVTVIDTAIGDGCELKIQWSGMSKVIKTEPLSKILRSIPKCTYAKIDCEGAEWGISEADFSLFNRIEMEVHDIGHPIMDMKKTLDRAGFNFVVENRGNHIKKLWIIHAIKRG